jgi:protein TonB
MEAMAFQVSRSDRLKAGLGAVGLQLVIGIALIAGLATTIPRPAVEDLKLFGIAPPPPPPPPVQREPRRPQHSQKQGAAAPPNLHAKATEIVAPRILPTVPPPVVTAQLAGVGAAASAGAASVVGPGTGSGGQGVGTGSGGSGDGDGDGDGGEIAPRWRKGRIKDSDYPRSAGTAGVGGTVSVRYTVTPAGRVTACSITRSSGNAELDATTCRLVEERYRYDPSRMADGTPIASTVVEDHIWVADKARTADTN